MKILFVTSEATPFWKSGGLADVARALPDALVARGNEVTIVHPYYRFLGARGIPTETVGFARIPWPGGDLTVRYLEDQPELRSPGSAPTLFIDQPYYFDITDPYGPVRFDRLAAGRRFALFCRAVVERARAWEVDIIHLNDWPTGLVPIYSRIDGVSVPSVFTIHNLGYQGNFPPGLLPEIGVPAEYFRIDNGLEYYGSASFLKAGLSLSDRLTTVSPTYAQEIQTPRFGVGLEGLLSARRADLTGILNGIDQISWNPETDPAIAANYSANNPGGKRINRHALSAEIGIDDGGPILIMISRLVEQKGIELVLNSFETLIRTGIRIVILGSGDTTYEEAIATMTERFPGRSAALFRFDEDLARRIYAGGDFFLMPSLYEPCGLGQMIAQRYGTPPIVRATGGLADTVADGRTGFAFREPTARGLIAAARRAASYWGSTEWGVMSRRCMDIDRAWTNSAAAYERIYHETIALDK